MMKTAIRSLLAASALSFMFAGSALAINASSQSVFADISGANLDSSSLGLSVQNGIVTLTGDVEDNIAKMRIEQAARNSAGVSGVINLISTN